MNYMTAKKQMLELCTNRYKNAILKTGSRGGNRVDRAVR